jgi:hypothetical protein
VCDANVRRAMSGATLFSRVLAAPTAILHGVDMLISSM